ncbi:glycoside hydrolase/deacetylase, partial [Fistulina hepatica ATCC 64428]
HTSRSQLPSTWYHPPDHPAHALFRRADLYTDGHQYAEVGSPAWSAGYPTDAPDPNNLPQAWRDALGAAVSAGKIPNIPLPTHNNDYPAYPEGYDPNGPQVCSSYYQCRGDDDIWDAPDGVIGISFDDGPLEPSPGLYDFLKNNNMTATHFFIGQNILQNPHLFQQAYEYGGDIAVHTWSHPYMSTMTNEQVLGELGWTMQIIHNSTGGRLPRYWRPPYGDSDSRVRAIAKEVFGLTAIIWNHDTEDWAITEGGTTVEAAQSSMTQWISGPKSPGLIILEHELSQQSVTVFTDSFPSMKANGWKVASVAQIAFPKFGSTPYQNA